VVLDQVQMNRIMSALFSNAVKYTEKGSITIDYAMKDNGLFVSIADTGLGIAKENHARIFNRFEKLDTATSGTGIGLSVCKAIVLKANGKIGVESEVGKGSTFWFWIPCKIS
jgi:signal transduction histidine kinase